jgi:hypothetical protein
MSKRFVRGSETSRHKEEGLNEETHLVQGPSERIKSAWEVMVSDNAREDQIRAGGPNILTGEGMQAHQFITRLDSHKMLSGWNQRSDSANSREQLQSELTQMFSNRKTEINTLINNQDAIEVFYARSHIMDDLSRFGHMFKHFSEKSVERSSEMNATARNNAFRKAVAMEYILEKLEWHLKNPNRVKEGAGRLSSATLARASSQLKESGETNINALMAIYYESERSIQSFRESIPNRQFDQKDFQNAYWKFRENRIIMIESAMGENTNVAYSSEEINQAPHNCVESMHSMLEIEIYTKKIISASHTEQATSSGFDEAGPSAIDDPFRD